ncbi:MAG: UUP1 family membrane protein [Thermodesulfobacteriota bacterium]
MSKIQLYVLASVVAAVGLSVFLYKVYFLGFPVTPAKEVHIWNVEARIKFVAEGKPVKVSMFIPTGTRRFAVMDETFASGGYGLVATESEGNRLATWSIREATGRQGLYYQAVVQVSRTKAPQVDKKAPKPASPGFEGPTLAAAKTFIEGVKAKSADTPSMVTGLLKGLAHPGTDENVRLLVGGKPSVEKRVKMAIRLLSYAGIPARMVRGVRIREEKADLAAKVPIIHWLEVFDGKDWTSFDPITGNSPVPDDWFPWWTGVRNMAHVEGGRSVQVIISVSPRIQEGVQAAVQHGQRSKALLVQFSLFSLPVATQAVYKVLLLIPVGTFVLIILRNVVGIKTFGTFMPVLIALSFRETGLLRGIFLFVVIVALGLGVRSYLERLKLLVVPRLAAVLIVVVGFMALLSVVSHHLGGHTGLSVALFPLVILTMTIERMSVVWEERGPEEAFVSGLGSLTTAALAFVVMKSKYLEHLVFVFPELLLVVLAITLLMGRYSGYRLMDLHRFRALAKE